MWSIAQKVRFIESIWTGLPIRVWVYNQVHAPNMHQADSSLLNGQQRIESILAYTQDSFDVFGLFFSELTTANRRRFSIISFAGLETQITDLAKLEEVYDRLAYGGTPHKPKAAT